MKIELIDGVLVISCETKEEVHQCASFHPMTMNGINGEQIVSGWVIKTLPIKVMIDDDGMKECFYFDGLTTKMSDDAIEFAVTGVEKQDEGVIKRTA